VDSPPRTKLSLIDTTISTDGASSSDAEIQAVWGSPQPSQSLGQSWLSLRLALLSSSWRELKPRHRWTLAGGSDIASVHLNLLAEPAHEFWG